MVASGLGITLAPQMAAHTARESRAPLKWHLSTGCGKRFVRKIGLAARGD